MQILSTAKSIDISLGIEVDEIAKNLNYCVEFDKTWKKVGCINPIGGGGVHP
jgi:hypothetical protein